VEPIVPAGSVVPAMRLLVVRGFARYMTGIDPRTQVPPTGLIRLRRHRRPPFIYSDEQLLALMERARTGIRQRLVGATYETLIGLLAATGMRISEAMSDRAEWETSPPGCRSSLVKLGKSEPGTAGEGGSSPDNAGSREHRRIAGARQAMTERRNEREPVIELPQDSTRLQPDGYGSAKRCAGSQRLRVNLAVDGEHFARSAVRGVWLHERHDLAAAGVCVWRLDAARGSARGEPGAADQPQ
jgi:hypothetical protein